MIDFGITLETFTPPGVPPNTKKIFEMATLAEKVGFSSVWVWDHLLLGSRRVYPVLEPLMILSALSNITKEVKLGLSTLVLPLREPVVLAKEIQTIEYISNERLLLGVAAGWYEKEFDAVGAKFSARGRKTEEYLRIIRNLLTEQDITAQIGDRKFSHTTMEPRPKTAPKILMGGYKVLKRIGEMSDGWISSYYAPDEFRETWLQILNYARAVGKSEKDMISVDILPICIKNSFEEADKVVRKFTAEYMDIPPWSKSTVESGIRGTAKECIDQIKKYEQVGLNTVELLPCYYDIEMVEKIGKEIIPAFIKK